MKIVLFVAMLCSAAAGYLLTESLVQVIVFPIHTAIMFFLVFKLLFQSQIKGAVTDAIRLKMKERSDYLWSRKSALITSSIFIFFIPKIIECDLFSAQFIHTSYATVIAMIAALVERERKINELCSSYSPAPEPET